MTGQRIKVLRIITRLNVGGPALHCMLLSEQLFSRGFDTTLVYGGTMEQEASFPQLFNITPQGFKWVQLTQMNRISGPISDLGTLFKLIRIMWKERPQIVHTHTAKAGVLGRVAAFVTGAPVVVHTFHGHVLSGYFGPIVSKLVAWVEKGLAYRTTLLITLSDKLRSELIYKFSIAPYNKFGVVPLGRNLNAFYECNKHRGELRKELGLSTQTKIIATVGRLTAIKNQKLLLATCGQLKDLDWTLVHVGEGELLEELKT